MTTAQAPSGIRPVIAFIGNRNAGKSSLLNKITNQELSIVSDIAGTTTDAVMKAYELIPAGPVTFYDTAGLDDDGKLGKERIKATEKIVKRADIIIYVIGKDGLDGIIEEKLRKMNIDGIKFIPVFNFSDCTKPDKYTKAVCQLYSGIRVSAKTGEGIEELKTRIVELLSQSEKTPTLITDLVTQKDVVILVTPIDLAAPKGRLILPQIQVIRELLDNNAIVITTKVSELENSLHVLKNKPALVITDSQAVKEVATIVPENIPLTTFSMLFARAKGNFNQMYTATEILKNLKDGNKVLIAEGCSHHITCDDIGRVKIPMLLKKYTGKELKIDFVSGLDFPEDLSSYDLVIHCGGCMLNKKEITRRLDECQKAGVPITNYGMVISIAQGVLTRVAQPLL